MQQARVGVILASVREARRGEALAGWIMSRLVERPDAAPRLLDLREFRLPAYTHHELTPVAEKSYRPESLERRWSDEISNLDAFVIVTPEYNHGYPGSLKNALDHVYTAWNYKPVAFLGYGGSAGGARAIEQLRDVATELRMVPIRDEVNVRLIGLSADERGWPKEEIYVKRAAAMLDELLWWVPVLREGRERHPR